MVRSAWGDMGECRFQGLPIPGSVFDYPHEMPEGYPGCPHHGSRPRPARRCTGNPVSRNFLNYHEKEKLLTRCQGQRGSTAYRTYFRTLSKPSLFFTDMEFDSRRALVAFLCGKLREQGYVGPGFLKRHAARIHCSCLLEPGFAFAHAMGKQRETDRGLCMCAENKLPWAGIQCEDHLSFCPGANLEPYHYSHL